MPIIKWQIFNFMTKFWRCFGWFFKNFWYFFWWTRLYVQSYYLTYQGNDLSSSLIVLSKGKKLDEKGLYYLKIFGANCYNIDRLDKKILWWKMSMGIIKEKY
jgi:DNA-directed RNA polymerase